MGDSASLNGWKYDADNGYLEAWQAGTKVIELDATDGLKVVVDGFDLAGQTLTSVNAAGSSSMITWLAALGAGADGSDDEDPVSAIAIKVGGTVAYVPCFASI